MPSGKTWYVSVSDASVGKTRYLAFSDANVRISHVAGLEDSIAQFEIHFHVV